MRSRRLSVRISSQLANRLRMRCREARQTESEIVRDALEKNLDEHTESESALDVFRKAGLTGIVKNASTVLSTSQGFSVALAKPSECASLYPWTPAEHHS